MHQPKIDKQRLHMYIIDKWRYSTKTEEEDTGSMCQLLSRMILKLKQVGDSPAQLHHYICVYSHHYLFTISLKVFTRSARFCSNWVISHRYKIIFNQVRLTHRCDTALFMNKARSHQHLFIGENKCKFEVNSWCETTFIEREFAPKYFNEKRR